MVDDLLPFVNLSDEEMIAQLDRIFAARSAL